jgi:hypothetical protein
MKWILSSRPLLGLDLEIEDARSDDLFLHEERICRGRTLKAIETDSFPFFLVQIPGDSGKCCRIPHPVGERLLSPWFPFSWLF